MIEYAGYISRVDLTGDEDGCATVDVRCKVSLADAKRLSRFMLEGHVLRVLVPGTPSECDGPKEAK